MDNPAQELALKNAIQDHNQTLVDIATGKVTSSEITEITSAQYTNQIKLFLLAQARKELMRVVKLTEFLTKVEDMYEERVMENLDKLSLDSFPDIISTITSCLKRSDDIMQSVLKNDSLKSLTLINYNSNNDTTITSDAAVNTVLKNKLNTPESREKVIRLANKAISDIATALGDDKQ